MQVWNVLCAARWKYRTKKSPKITIWAPSHNFVRLYLRNWGTYRQSEKKLKQQYLLHMSPQYGELRTTSGWDPSGSLGHPCKFQRVSRLGSVTTRHSSRPSARQPNFVTLNRGCYLCSAGRPSRWAWAHISTSFFSSPNLSGRRCNACLPYFHIWCCLTANSECMSEMCCKRLAGNTGRKNRHLRTIAQLCQAISSQLRHVSTIWKNVKQQCALHMSA